MDVSGLPQVLNLDPLRLLEGQAALKSLLTEISGAEIEALLAARNADGLLLQLAGGRSLTAAGDLPFPEGTRLLFRAVPSPDGALLRLQPLEATPPPPPAVLLPLLQGEAQPLLQRLLSEAPLPGPLQPILDLLKATLPAPLSSAPESAAPSSPAAPLPSASNPAAAPTTPLSLPAPLEESAIPAPTLLASWPDPPVDLKRPLPASSLVDSPLLKPLQAFLTARGLPPEVAKAWAEALLRDPEALPAPLQKGPEAKALPFPSEGEPAEAAALSARIQDPASPAPAVSPEWLPPRRSAGEALPAAPLPNSRPQDPAGKPRLPNPQEELVRAQVPDVLIPKFIPLLLAARNRGSDTPLDQLFRALFPQTPATDSKAATAPLLKASTTPPSAAEAGVAMKSAPSASVAKIWMEPETWETWIRGTTSALAHPEVSPRESPFHALQSREGTAYFELPLPIPHLKSPLEMWVEEDRANTHPESAPAIRIMLALEMEGTGPVRLGIERIGASIHADLWVDEQRREAITQALRSEWGDTPPYHLRIRSFQGPQPTLRHLAAGATFGAIG
jgi:hypothetical protein